MADEAQSTDLQQPAPEQGMLYLCAAQAGTRSILAREIRRHGLTLHEPFPDVLAVAATAAQLNHVAHDWRETLIEADLASTPCLFTTSSAGPTYAEFMQSESLASLIDRLDARWLRPFVESGRLLTHFQPIVQTAEPHIVYGYECLLRGRDASGVLVEPHTLYSAARRASLLDFLDDAARVTAIESAARLRLNTRVFINFNPRSIEDPFRSLRGALHAVLTSANAPDNYIFEVVETDKMADTGALLAIADHIRLAGCRLALDDVGAGYNSLNLISVLKPDLIKLDMCMTRGIDRDSYKSRITAKVLELARELRIQTVVEGVETKGEWQWACEYGADFAQGYLFAKPAENPPASSFSVSPDYRTSAGRHEATDRPARHPATFPTN